MLLSKRGKEVSLGALIGERARDFSGGSYVNFYLSPRNRHFWVTPCCGRFIHTHCNEGKAVLPVFIGLEGVLGIELFPAAARQNASIGSLFATQGYDLALVAVGSLNVNRIHVTYEQGVQYSQGTPCGYFSIGSSMLLCLPFTSTFRVTTGDSVRIGQRVL